MNIRFHNLGKIKETELDLKPMTVIIGPNNSNKTYIAYSVYGLWQQMFTTNGALGSLQDQSSDSVPISLSALHESFVESINDSVHEFVGDLENFYQDSSHTLFTNTQLEIVVTPTEFEAAIKSLVGDIQVPEQFANIFNITAFRITLEDGLLIATPIDNTVEIKHSKRGSQFNYNFQLVVGIALNRTLRRQLFGYPYLLPAERNAFVITYKVLANRRLKLMLDAQRRLFSSRQTSKRQFDLLKESGEVRYPQPIEDFLEFLFEVESETNPASPQENHNEMPQRPKRRRASQNGIGKLASDIEQSIQNGNKINFRATALGGQEIMVDVGNGLNIDLYNASSSIKQLAPLLLYLRYRAAKGDLLIIDEPEMNLHPESQAKLLEVLAMLVNQGVYVLLTTHSPYIMSHLNNLAQATEVSTAGKRKQAKSLYLGDAMALLDMDQISAYEMRDNQLHSLKDPDYGIRWDTLSDVSGDLQQKYFQIYEEGHTPDRAKTTRKSKQTPSE